MKSSDSSTSLTELVISDEKDECFICLDSEINNSGEPVVTSKLLRTCGCKFFVHPICWNQWMRGKSDWDCPFCHKNSIRNNIPPNPVLELNITFQGTNFLCRNFVILILFILLALGLGFLIASFFKR